MARDANDSGGAGMTTRKDDNRRLIQITVQPDLYDKIRQHCNNLDMPITVWVRGLMREAMANPSP
jgi:hypothetical protein